MLLLRRSAARKPRQPLVRLSGADWPGVHASRQERRDRRPALPTGSCASRKRCGHVVKRPHEPHFLLARQPAPVRQRARFGASLTVSIGNVGPSVRGQPIPGGAERLKRFLQRCQGLRSFQMASSSLGGTMERVGSLDQCGCGVAQGVLGSHGNDAAPGGASDPWVSIPNRPTRIPHLQRRGGLYAKLSPPMSLVKRRRETSVGWSLASMQPSSCWYESSMSLSVSASRSPASSRSRSSSIRLASINAMHGCCCTAKCSFHPIRASCPRCEPPAKRRKG